MLTWESTRNGAKWAWQRCLEWIFPRTCLACGRFLDGQHGRYTCGPCRRRIQLIRKPYCPCCGVPFHGRVEVPARCPACLAAPPVFDYCRSLFLYRGTGARMVHSLKYEQGLWLRDEVTALLLEDSRWQHYFDGACLVPVPLHRGKERQRGYNQAAIIVEAIAAAFPSTSKKPFLERIRKTPSQTFLSREQRKRNMRGAFTCRNSPSPQGRFVLVDDVLTTGATLNAAAMALKRDGATRISAFTLAHG